MKVHVCLIRQVCLFPTRDDSGDRCTQATKERRRRLIHPDFETHGQSHPKSETEGTSGPTKRTSVQQKFKKIKVCIYHPHKFGLEKKTCC